MAFAGIANYVTKSIDVSSTSSSSPDDVYVCPNNFVALLRFIHISNGDAQKKISLYWYQADTATHHYIVDEFKPDANQLHEVVQGGGYLALKPGDKIQAFKESGGDFHITVSGEEHFQPTLG